jgi:putative lipoic acid-binding regulatory protein
MRTLRCNREGAEHPVTHSPLISRDAARIIGCTCGWRTPPGVSDSDYALAAHVAIANIYDKPESKLERESAMAKKGSEGSFNGCKVFCATMFHQRQVLGEQVTEWLEAARKRPGFSLVDVLVRQSSDEAYHCLSIVIFFNEEKKRHV